MKIKNLTIAAAGIILFLLIAGAAGAINSRQTAVPAVPQAGVASAITYQGRLTNPGGVGINGTVPMRFVVYDADVGGSALWDSGDIDVQVEGGLFEVNLGVDQADFNGQALWLNINIDGETLSPRQEIVPAAYALSLRPGADIVGESIAEDDAILAGYAPATGSALYADAAGGAGMYSQSQANYAVWGASTNSWGGYFTSENGYAIRANTKGSDHYDHGAYITSQGGYAVYAQSANNMAIRGEAGDISGISVPLGTVGVAGIGQNRGVYGASESGSGIYGTSKKNYGGYFYSEEHRGIYSSSPSGLYAGYFTNRGGASQAGVYINGTLTVAGSKSGYVVDVSLNDGRDLLEAGDVVAVVGVSDAVLGQIPVMRVVKATADNATAVVGVVDQRFIIDQQEKDSLPKPDAAAPKIDANSAIQQGEYLSVVTLGAYKEIKVDAGYGAIQPGDLLTPSPNPGYAMRASDPTPGTIVGKALENLEIGQGLIAVYITMQ